VYLLILGLVVGAVLPIMVAAAIIFFGSPRGGRSTWPMAVALGKGIGLGIAVGVSASALVVGLGLGLRWLSGR